MIETLTPSSVSHSAASQNATSPQHTGTHPLPLDSSKSLLNTAFLPKHLPSNAVLFNSDVEGFNSFMVTGKGVTVHFSVHVIRIPSDWATSGTTPIEEILVTTGRGAAESTTFRFGLKHGNSPVHTELQSLFTKMIVALGYRPDAIEPSAVQITQEDRLKAISLIKDAKAIRQTWIGNRDDCPVEFSRQRPIDGQVIAPIAQTSSASLHSPARFWSEADSFGAARPYHHEASGKGLVAFTEMLNELLLSSGINPKDWEKVSGKNITHLAKEIAAGETVLYKITDRRKTRFVLSGDVVVLELQCDAPPERVAQGHGNRLILLEKKRSEKDGNGRSHPLPRRTSLGGAPAEKVVAGESFDEAAQRGVQEETRYGSNPATLKELILRTTLRWMKNPVFARAVRELSNLAPDSLTERFHTALEEEKGFEATVALTQTGIHRLSRPSGTYPGLEDCQTFSVHSGEAPYRKELIERHGRRTIKQTFRQESAFHAVLKEGKESAEHKIATFAKNVGVINKTSVLSHPRVQR